MIRTVTTVAGDPSIGQQTQGLLKILRFVLIGAVLLAYCPLFTAEFTCWDDSYNVAENPKLNPPTWENVAYYWKNPAYDLYIPVTYTVWAAIARVGYVPSTDASGSHLNSYLFHTANVLLHAGAALAVMEILRKLLRAKDPKQARGNAPAVSVAGITWPAFVGAMVFALHPVQVEAVGWVAGTKDVLAGLFSVLALWMYLPGESESSSFKFEISNLRLAGATAFVILAMLCKPIAMMTPLIAIAMDLAVLKRFRWRVLIWFVPAILCAIVARRAQPAHFGGIIVPLWSRPLIAGDSIAFYLYKLIWPLKLGVDYGRTPRQTLASQAPFFTALVPLAIAIVLWIWRRRAPVIVAGCTVFVLGIAPVSGLTRFDFQIYSTVADHYLYLPMLGAAMVVAALLYRSLGRESGDTQPRTGVRGYDILALAILLLLGVRTFLQSRTWHDSISLFSHALEVNPRSWMSHDNLASAYLRLGEPEKAKPHCLAAIAIKPDVANVYDQLALCLETQGKTDEALDAYRTAVKLQTNDASGWLGMAELLMKKGDRTSAIDAYQHAVDYRPDDAEVMTNFASTLAEDGQLDRAIAMYQRALRIKPNSPQALEGLARAIREKQKQDSPQRRGGR